MKKLLSLLIVFAIFSVSATAVNDADSAGTPQIQAPSAILIEQSTGTVLYEKNVHEQLRPASVTKIMTLLLTMEAIEDGYMNYDTVLTASEHAANMGGSQVFLEPGEQMTLHEALKCIAVSSANDACVMVGEHIAGSEEGFVAKMNERAQELGMKDTHFVNCTGLDADGHVTSAYDISIMSRELLSHEGIRNYTTIWMDSIRDGAFGLSNTNKLIRFYNGATGLKTGFTTSAGYCVSASAMRDGMELIAVIMKSDTSQNRNADASTLLNYGFSQYALYTPEFTEEVLTPIPVLLGKESHANTVIKEQANVLVKKGDLSKISVSFERVDTVEAPVEAGQKIGTYTIMLDGQKLATLPIVTAAGVERKNFGDVYGLFLRELLMRDGKKDA